MVHDIVSAIYKDGYKIEVKFDDGKGGVVDFSILSELSLDERGPLAAKILLSLEEPSEEEVEKLWIAEAERRPQEYREGVTFEEAKLVLFDPFALTWEDDEARGEHVL